MITVTDLRKVYRQGDRDVTALDGVSLSVPRSPSTGSSDIPVPASPRW